MRFTGGLAAIVNLAQAWPTSTDHTLSPRSTSYKDPETGFTFSETKAAATLTSNIIYRIAQPANISANQPYDIVLQVIAPSSLGWVGLAWGGNMVRNPLTVSYPNGQKATVSSRWATYVLLLLPSHSPLLSPTPHQQNETKQRKLANRYIKSGHSTPQQYPSATYTQLSAGNKANGTHWQVTVKCTGCTTYNGSSGPVYVEPSGSRRLAFACSQGKVSNPGSTSASIPVHDVYNYITHDFSAGRNEGWAALLERNGV
ncbi:hypothetical protein J3E73DRAFT_258250 [Bipolaris maydis]|nr:hypothetical protein J3E73DRAFT_258250 [Bipolaris maydis]